jgi:hypothetical protein
MLKNLFLIVSIIALAAITSLAQPGSSAPAASSSSSSSAAKPAAFRATKDQIKQGQQILIAQKLWAGEATGVYGESRDAIKAYQKANKLDANGRFDRATLEKMGIALTDKQKGMASASSSSTSAKGDSTKQTAAGGQDTAGPKRPAPFRAGKDQIEAAQKILRDGKMLTGGEDGKLDDLTRDGLGKYQEANSLKVTKTLNAATLGKMGIALTDKQKEQVAAQAAYDAGKKN